MSKCIMLTCKDIYSQENENYKIIVPIDSILYVSQRTDDIEGCIIFFKKNYGNHIDCLEHIYEVEQKIDEALM